MGFRLRMLWYYLLLHFPSMYLGSSTNEFACNYDNYCSLSLPTELFHLHLIYPLRTNEDIGASNGDGCGELGTNLWRIVCDISSISFFLALWFVASRRVEHTRGVGGRFRHSICGPLSYHNSCQGRMPCNTSPLHFPFYLSLALNTLDFVEGDICRMWLRLTNTGTVRVYIGSGIGGYGIGYKRDIP